MARVADSLTWDVMEERVRDAVGVAAGADDTLKGLFYSALNNADRYLANPFTDAAGADIPIPGGTWNGYKTDAVVEGVLVWVHSMYNGQGKTGPDPNVTSVRIGDNSVGYAGSAVTRNTPAKLAGEAAAGHWAPFRCKVWR